MKTLLVKLPEPLAAKLAATAKKQRTKKVVVMRDALAAYLGGTVLPVKGSVLDLTKNLAGSVKGGPSDLSYNKAHLCGLGR